VCLGGGALDAGAWLRALKQGEGICLLLQDQLTPLSAGIWQRSMPHFGRGRPRPAHVLLCGPAQC
jgi:hypothetical protein